MAPEPSVPELTLSVVPVALSRLDEADSETETSVGRLSSEMAFRERAPGAGLQVLFKLDRAGLAREGHDDDDSPRSTSRGVPRHAGVVVSQPPAHVRRQTGVVPNRIERTLQDVHESARRSHNRADAIVVPSRFLRKVGSSGSWAASGALISKSVVGPRMARIAIE